MGKMDEMILVTKREALFNKEKLFFDGVMSISTHKHSVEKIIKNLEDNIEVMRRGDAEENPLYKQPIPYAVIKRGNEVFVYERLEGAGETRLHSKLSLGVGGHMNAIENAETFNDVLMENLNRELKEELKITSPTKPELRIIGLINDDSDEVGRVHLGILAIIEVSEDTTVEVRETEQLRGNFFPIEKLKLKQFYDRLENWSKIVIDIL